MPNYPFTDPNVLTFQEVLLLMSLMATTRSLTQSFVGWYLKRKHTQVITNGEENYECETIAVLPDGRTAFALNDKPACTVKYHGRQNIWVIPDDTEGPQNTELYISSYFQCSAVFHISSNTDLDDTIKVIIQHAACPPTCNSRICVWGKEVGEEWKVIKTGKDCNFPEDHEISFETDKLGHYMIAIRMNSIRFW